MRKQNVERETHITQDLADQPLHENSKDETLKEIFKNSAFTNIKCTSSRAHSLRAAQIRKEFCRFFNEEEEIAWQNIQIYK